MTSIRPTSVALALAGALLAPASTWAQCGVGVNAGYGTSVGGARVTFGTTKDVGGAFLGGGRILCAISWVSLGVAAEYFDANGLPRANVGVILEKHLRSISTLQSMVFVDVFAGWSLDARKHYPDITVASIRANTPIRRDSEGLTLGGGVSLRVPVYKALAAEIRADWKSARLFDQQSEPEWLNVIGFQMGMRVAMH